MTRITMCGDLDMRVDLKGQGNKVKVMSSVWRMFVRNSTTNCRRNTKIGMKVIRATANIPHHIKGQKVWVAVQVTICTGRGHILAVA